MQHYEHICRMYWTCTTCVPCGVQVMISVDSPVSQVQSNIAVSSTTKREHRSSQTQHYHSLPRGNTGLVKHISIIHYQEGTQVQSNISVSSTTKREHRCSQTQQYHSLPRGNTGVVKHSSIIHYQEGTQVQSNIAVSSTTKREHKSSQTYQCCEQQGYNACKQTKTIKKRAQHIAELGPFCGVY